MMRLEYINKLIQHEKTFFASCLFNQEDVDQPCLLAQSDQCLCCLLPRPFNGSSFSIKNFKPPACLNSWAACLNLTISETHKAGFLVTWLIFSPLMTGSGKTCLLHMRNKGADQLCSNCTPDQLLCFCYIHSTMIPLLSKSEIWSF